MAGIRRDLDIFGVLVLSFAASSFGGIARDVLIGAGLIAFFWSSLIEKLRNPVRLMDAIGLAFFAVSGAEKALAFGLSPVMAALPGMLTGIGGGVTRDVLLAEVPAVLRSDLYAWRLWPARRSWWAAACCISPSPSRRSAAGWSASPSG